MWGDRDPHSGTGAGARHIATRKTAARFDIAEGRHQAGSSLVSRTSSGRTDPDQRDGKDDLGCVGATRRTRNVMGSLLVFRRPRRGSHGGNRRWRYTVVSAERACDATRSQGFRKMGTSAWFGGAPSWARRVVRSRARRGDDAARRPARHVVRVQREDVGRAQSFWPMLQAARRLTARCSGRCLRAAAERRYR
jgi:hypothetical protein